MAFKPNKTLAGTVYEAMRRKRVPIAQRMYVRTCFIFASDDKLRDLELELTSELKLAGVIAPEAIVDNCYAGDWGVPPILDWILEHWEEILKIIMTIIGLFGVSFMSAILILVALLGI